MKVIPVNGLVAKSIKPFTGVQFEKDITFCVNGKDRHFHLFTYQAYDAMGLIGPEMNGVAICDADKRQVLCDGIKKQDSGYFGASQTQVDELELIAKMDWEQFKAYVNACPRRRCLLDDGPKKLPKMKTPSFKAVQFMTAKQKTQVYKEWVQFMRGGFRQEDFTQAIYQHLSLHASFIAHFNIHGFYGHYFEQTSRTMRFLDQFDRAKECRSVEMGGNYWLNDRDYHDLNNAMVDAIAADLPELRRKLLAADLAVAQRALAAAQDRVKILTSQVA